MPLRRANYAKRHALLQNFLQIHWRIVKLKNKLRKLNSLAGVGPQVGSRLTKKIAKSKQYLNIKEFFFGECA